MPFFNGGSSGSGGSGSGNLPVLTGSGAPGSTLGSTGQIYIDSTNNVFYGPKGSSGWPTGISFGAGSYSELTGVPSEFTPETHTHAIADVTDLQTELDAKADSTHTHVIADVTSLQTELDAKATTTELTTAVSDLIDGAPDDLNTLDKLAASIADNAAYATAVNLALAGKSDTTHQHSLQELSNVSGTPLIGQLLRFNGTNWTPITQEETANTLMGLSDVSTVTPTSGDYLKWDGSQWYAGDVTVDYSTGSGNLVLSPFTSIVEIRGNGTDEGSLQLNCSQNTHGVKIQSPPHSVSASYTLTLPDDAGSSGQVLQTDGTGGLSWLTVGGSGNSVTFSSVPVTETAAGSVGEMALDSLHLYVCVATNSWKRIPLQDFSGNTGGGGGSTTGIFITQQPSGGTTQNGNFTLSLSATVPSGSINYQWQKLGSGGGSGGGSGSISLKAHPGAVFEGEDSGDFFGWKLEVSGDGNTIIASGYLNDDSGYNMGMARVLRWNGTAWAQIGGDINTPNTTTAGPYFGGTVAISHDGNTIAIGGGTTVSVYDWNSSTSAWDIQTPLIGVPASPNPWGSTQTSSGAEPNDLSLNEDGTRLAICWHEYKISSSQHGAVFIYDRASTSVAFGDVEDSYFPLASTVQSGRYYYYTSVSLSKDGNKIACGGWRWDSPSGVGQVGGIDVFEWDSTTSSWSQMGSSIYGDSLNDYLTNRYFQTLGTNHNAMAISDDGTHVIAGARESSGNSTSINSGYAAVWSYNGSAWVMKGNAFRGDQTDDQSLGTDVDISSDGSRVVITSDGLDARSSTNPAFEYRYPQIQVYDWNSSTSSWDEVGTIYSPDADSTGQIPQTGNFNIARYGCLFGAVASLSSDGSKLIASAPGSALTAAGRLLEYEFVSSGSGSSGSGSTWLNVSGEVYSSLELTGQTASNNGDQYRCFLTASGFSDVVSNTATIAVTDSGVQGVTSTAPSLMFDRNFADTYNISLWRATGGNWSYQNAGWTLVKEQTKWEFTSTNLATTTSVTGASSLANRTGSFTYGLMGVPPKVTTLNDSYSYHNSSSVPAYYVSILNQVGFDSEKWASWGSPNSANGKWNRAARFATRVILQRFVNGVEEQVTTDYSQFSDWRSDPGGNIFTTQDTVFTTQPTGSHTMYPGDTHTINAEIIGTNKRYLWQVDNSFNENDWFTGEELSDGRFYADDSLLLRSSNSTLSDVGSHAVRCLGASNWNKAVFSSAKTIIIPSTDDSSSSPISVSEMDGFRTYSYYDLDGNGSFEDTDQFFIPKIKLMKSGTVFLDLSGASSLSNAQPYTSQQYFRNGRFKFIFEFASNYGTSSGPTWQSLSFYTKNIDSDGDWSPPGAAANSGYGSIRVKWKMEDVDVSEDYETTSSSTNLTTVWSDWIY